MTTIYPRPSTLLRTLTSTRYLAVQAVDDQQHARFGYVCVVLEIHQLRYRGVPWLPMSWFTSSPTTFVTTVYESFELHLARRTFPTKIWQVLVCVYKCISCFFFTFLSNRCVFPRLGRLSKSTTTSIGCGTPPPDLCWRGETLSSWPRYA